jgi:hypothetical protein
VCAENFLAMQLLVLLVLPGRNTVSLSGVDRNMRPRDLRQMLSQWPEVMRTDFVLQRDGRIIGEEESVGVAACILELVPTIRGGMLRDQPTEQDSGAFVALLVPSFALSLPLTVSHGNDLRFSLSHRLSRISVWLMSQESIALLHRP